MDDPGAPEPVDRCAGHVVAVDDDQAVGGCDEPRGHPGDGGLADAVRPEERHRLAWFDGQLHIEERTEGAVASGHVVEVEHAGHDDVPTLPR